MATAGFFFSGKACYFVVQSGNNFGEPFHPRSGPLTLRETHFNGVLVPKQTLAKDAVDTLNNGLVAVNVNVSAPDVCFVIFHVFCNSAHEFAPRVNLQHLWPSQR